MTTSTPHIQYLKAELEEIKANLKKKKAETQIKADANMQKALDAIETQQIEIEQTLENLDSMSKKILTQGQEMAQEAKDSAQNTIKTLAEKAKSGLNTLKEQWDAVIKNHTS